MKTGFIIVEHTAQQRFDPNEAPRVERSSQHELLRAKIRAVALRTPPGCNADGASCPNPAPLREALTRKGIEVIDWAQLSQQRDPIAAARQRGVTMILDLHTLSFFEGPTEGAQQEATRLIKSNERGEDWGIPQVEPEWSAALKAQTPPIQPTPQPTRQAFIEISARAVGGQEVIWLFRQIMGDQRARRVSWRQLFYCEDKRCVPFPVPDEGAAPPPPQISPLQGEQTPKDQLLRALAKAAMQELLSPPRL
ncbi:hypothetical protein KKF91_15530 [Myxococcota bacterium]|nr:hypothetical protein [Myxococcota bacterium]MBU1431952.1 hypothetical protein [Myxococcota bacterium]MBU1898816.1 hypothetical protein [Myxococcota bacterium]